MGTRNDGHRHRFPVTDFDASRSGEHAPEGFASPALTRPSVRFARR